jgi:cardiolipin synthase (CMP-forming)
VQQIPLFLTLFRLLSSPLLAWLLFRSRFREALFLIFVAGITDWLDGWSARRLHVSGKVGVVLDPLADKVLLTTLFIVLGLIGLLPLWILALGIGRDLVIVTGAFLLRVLRGYRQFLPSVWGKVSTFFQIVLVFLILTHAAYPHRFLEYLANLALLLATFFTVISGIDYVRRGIEMTKRRSAATIDGLKAQE